MAAAATPAGVDLAALGPFFAERVPGYGGGALEASLIEGGRSNLTYVITEAGTDRQWVLRRPPLGHVLPTAHDMGREYRLLSALDGTAVPVPHPIADCTDEELIGAPFYVMDLVDGLVVRDAATAASLSGRQAGVASAALVEVLARIHAVDPAEVGLERLGKPEGYLERQVTRWGQQWERSATRPLASLDDVVTRLKAALPDLPPGGSGIVHGDYRLDNTILDRDDPGTIRAVVDWEMATLGDPLADVGLLLVYMSDASADVVDVAAAGRANPGFWSPDRIAEGYAGVSGRDLGAIDFYVVLGYFKLAVVAEGIHARFTQGKTVGEGFEHIGRSVPVLLDAALDVAAGSELRGLRG
jgi:aminoglycoside phosphotransferase (APT) family kinase protein